MHPKIKILQGFNEIEKKNLLNTIVSRTNDFKKEAIIAYSLNNSDLIGIIEEGEIEIIRYDYNGKRTVIERLEAGEVFSDLFLSTYGSEVIVSALSPCRITFFHYEELQKRCRNGSLLANRLFTNLFSILTQKLMEKEERIEILTKRSIREKLLAYFTFLSKKTSSKTFNLQETYTDLADYLAVDRSALMRELKHLKEEGFIKEINKKITLLT